MNRWESLVDQIVKEAIGDGNISHLPGAGKPLDLSKDALTPNDQRLAYKIMKDNDYMPDWIAVGQSLDEKEVKLRQQIAIRANRFVRDVSTARRKGQYLTEIEAEKSWKTYVEDFAERVGRYNKEVLAYNISVPQNVSHKQILVSEKLVAKALQVREGDS